MIPELATLFLEGTIMGRFFCDAPNHFILQPEYARELAFLKSLLNYTRHGLPWLRFGEYLHPLDLLPTPAKIEFRESTRSLRTQVPVVMHSVTRSHTDGSVAIVLVNIGDRAEKVRVPVNPSALGAAKGELLRLDEEGKITPLASSKTSWTQELEIKPLEVAFLVLR